MNLESRFHQDEELGIHTLHCTMILLQQHSTAVNIYHFNPKLQQSLTSANLIFN